MHRFHRRRHLYRALRERQGSGHARLSKRMITFNTVSPNISDGLVSCWTTSQPCYYWYDRYINRDQAAMRMENAKVTMRSAGCETGQARIDSIIMCMSISVMLMNLSSQGPEKSLYVHAIVLRRMVAPVDLRLACRPIASPSLLIPITHPPQCDSETISVIRIQSVALPCPGPVVSQFSTDGHPSSAGEWLRQAEAPGTLRVVHISIIILCK